MFPFITSKFEENIIHLKHYLHFRASFNIVHETQLNWNETEALEWNAQLICGCRLETQEEQGHGISLKNLWILHNKVIVLPEGITNYWLEICLHSMATHPCNFPLFCSLDTHWLKLSLFFSLLPCRQEYLLSASYCKSIFSYRSLHWTWLSNK